VPCKCGEDRLLVSGKPTVTWIHFVPFVSSGVSTGNSRDRWGY
jgi:hypothetical protein